MTRSLFSLVLLTVCASACKPAESRYDAAASQAFRAAWEKRRAGDEAGYRAALAEVAKRRGTWAGDRAALDSELVDGSFGNSMMVRLLKQAAELAGNPSKLPGGVLGGPAAAPADPAK